MYIFDELEERILQKTLPTPVQSLVFTKALLMVLLSFNIISYLGYSNTDTCSFLSFGST